MPYIRYILKNIEPLRITDNSTSQSGQMDTLTYIPGMTIRGVVISALAEKLEKSEPDTWKQLRWELFSDQVSYLNAYPIKRVKEVQSKENQSEGIELIPSPKGFYEDKKQSKDTKMKNVLKEDISGWKRASLGRYCYMSKEKIYFSNVALGSDLRISMGNKEQEKNMFRGQYMIKDQMFCGYIIVKKPELCDTINSALRDTIVLGNGRSAGMGKCRMIKKEIVQEFPYQSYRIQQAKEGSCYLYLLSNTVMCKENGELTGIDIPTLEKQLGVEKLKIEVCATSVLKNNGYNRIWDARLPEMLMYEMGSVFRLTYQGVIEKERAEAIAEEGIGLRKNEGFGRVLILENYEKLEKKQKIEIEEGIAFTDLPEKEFTEEEKQVLTIAAKGYYLEKLEQAGKKYLVDPKNKRNPILSNKLAGSQMGTIESYAASLQFMPKRAEKVLMSYLEHAVEKDEARRVHSNQQKRNEVKDLIEKLLKSNPEEFLESELKEKESIMGIPKKELFTEEELLIWKMQFLIEMIRYANKEDDNGENIL